MKKAILGAALAGSMLLTGAYTGTAGPSAEREPGLSYDPGAEISPGQQQELRQDFQDIKDYWVAKKPEVRKVRLSLLTEGITEQCGDLVLDAGPGANALYCYINDDVILNQAAINWFNSEAKKWFVPKASMFKLIFAHEFGHVIQDFDGVDLASITTVEASKRVELQADCYGGVSTDHVAGMPVTDEVIKYYESLGNRPDPEHGTSTERFASFDKGMRTGNC